MIKNILVPASGSATDDAVFATALAIARPLDAHLQFFHLRPSVGEAACRVPHMDFCRGTALGAALRGIGEREAHLASQAALNVSIFCDEHGIDIQDAPNASDTLTASWSEEIGDAEGRLLIQARHCDLAVLGRPHHLDYLPPQVIEVLLMASGRPIVVAPDSAPPHWVGTVMVGWTESAQAARALGAALPLLRRMQRVVLVAIDEDERLLSHSLAHLARQLAWHGVDAETRPIIAKRRTAPDALPAIAADMRADLLVVGGFEHGPIHEMMVGGVTRNLIEHADLPVFMMH